MQSKLDSLKEALVNTGIGFCLAFVNTCVILPAFGYPFQPVKFGGITLCFTLISVLRTYAVRRLFNKKSSP